MKVLFVYSGNSKSGRNAIIERQAESLRKYKIEVVLFPLSEKGLIGYVKFLIKLKQHLKDNHFSIIHAHYGLSAIVALFARNGQKLVVSFMGDDLVGTNLITGKISIKSKVLIKINCLLARYFYDFVIVKSNEMKEKLLKGTIHALIPNGVDISSFYSIDRKTAKEKLGINSLDNIVLFASDPERIEKNFKLAHTAVSLINNPHLKLRTVHGVSSETLLLHYNAADTLLLTSYHEGSPNVVKEAMACNCPIVSTNVGDVEWLFENLEGHYITSFNAHEIASKIQSAIHYRDKYQFTKGKGKLLKLKLDSNSVAKEIITVYEKTLGTCVGFVV